MEELPKRKSHRLQGYDYSKNGYYFLTICTDKRKPNLSNVGRGLAPAANSVVLSGIGKIAEEQLFVLETKYPFLKIDRYVIMPNHIHAIFVLNNKTAGASPRPTVMDIVCAYKSQTTRICNKEDNIPGRKIFQKSFYDEIIRNQEAYDKISKYIYEKPMNWELDELFINN